MDNKKNKVAKRWQIFSVFVFFSTILWFLNALNQEYTTKISIPVRFYNFPENKANISDLPKNFTATVKSYGYNIFKYQLRKNFTPVKIDLSDAKFNKLNTQDTNNFFLLSKKYNDNIEEQLLSDINIQILKPDTLFFYFTENKKKKVPVVVDAQINPLKQHFQKKGFKITPDSVTIKGPAIVIDTIEKVKTVFFVLDQIKATSDYIAQIEKIENITINPDKVTVTTFIEEYTEKRISMDIKKINVPDSVNLLLFPNKIDIVYKVGLSDYNKVNENKFKAIVDYSQVYGTHLPVKIISYPEKVYEYYHTPEFVEYIIEEND